MLRGSAAIVFQGEDAWFDLAITDEGGTQVDLNALPDWDVYLIIQGTDLGTLSRSGGDLTVNDDGTLRLDLSDQETAAMLPNQYPVWAKLVDSNGREWVILDGSDQIKLRDNPLKNL